MKKLFLFMMVALAAVCVSCSSDDDDAEASFAATDIIAVPQSQGVYNGFLQYQMDYAVLNKKEEGVSVTWNDSEQGESTGDTLYFFPQKTGEHTITATLHKNGSTKQLTKTFEVKQCNGTFVVRGQNIEDAFANEVYYAWITYGTQPSNLDYNTETYNYTESGNGGTIVHRGLRYKFYERQRNIYRAYECDNGGEEITWCYAYTIN